MSEPGGHPAIRASGLVKRYGTTTALDGFDLVVPAGSVCGLLGPNGAGKTTAVRILTTLVRADDGEAEVDGHDVRRAAGQVRRRIGLVGQHAALDESLSGRENLVMFGRLFHIGVVAARRRADELLARFQLEEAADRPVKRYSGWHAPSTRPGREPDPGARRPVPRRADDRPRSARAQRGAGPRSARLVRDGTTVLLTTQYLDEADQLADRISVVDAGRVIAEGTPDDLKSRIGARPPGVRRAPRGGPARHRATSSGASPARPWTSTPMRGGSARRWSIDWPPSAPCSGRSKRAIIDVEDVSVRRPTLDEVFLQLNRSAGCVGCLLGTRASGWAVSMRSRGRGTTS